MGFTSVASETSQISIPQDIIDSSQISQATQVPKPLILDMDFCTDVDDACALRVAATLHKMGKIDLKAVCLCVTGGNNLEAANGLLEHDGVHNIPIGRSSQDIPDTSPYWGILSQYSSNLQVIDSVKLYRYIISTSPTPVTIVTTGYVTNLADFMKSQPDEISPKTGLDLVRENVAEIYIQGGGYPEGLDNNFFYEEEARAALDSILQICAKPLYFIQANTGGPATCGAVLQQNAEYKNDPVTKALYAFGTSNGRAAWDPMAVWIASSNDLAECGVAAARTDIEFNKYTGANKFVDSPTGAHYRVYRTSDNLKWYSNRLDELVICRR